MLSAVTDQPPDDAVAPVVTPSVAGYDQSFDGLFAIAYRVAYRVLGSRDEADDIAGETLMRAWPSWGRIEGHAPAWVAKVSGNLAISQIRRRSLGERLPWRPPATPTHGSDLRHDLTVALRKLPRRQRQVLVLRYLADLPEHEVARVLGCSVGTVKQHAHRALAALRTDAGLDQEDR